MSTDKQLHVTSEAKEKPSTQDTSEVVWTYKSETRQFVWEHFKSKSKLGKFQVAIILLLSGLGRELSRSQIDVAFGKRLKFETEKSKIKSIASTLKRMDNLGYIEGYRAEHLQYQPMMYKANTATLALAKAIIRDIANNRFSGFGMGNMDLRDPVALLNDARKNLEWAFEYANKENE